MRECVLKKGLVIGIIILFIGTSIPIVNAHIEKNTLDEAEINPYDIEEYIKLFDEDVQQRIRQSLENGLSIYLTFSTSGLGKAHRIYFPFLLRILKPHGIFFAALIFYSGISALTTIWEWNIGTGIQIVDGAVGPHLIFIVGLGYTSAKRNIGDGKGRIVAVSLTKPLIL